MKSLYLILNLFTISFPLLRSFESRIKYAKKWKQLFPGLLVTASFFLIWDVIFTKNGIWGFNPMYLTGIYFLGLPVEEWLFFFTVPFASVFIYESVCYFFPAIPSPAWLRIFTLFSGLFLIACAVINRSLAYTFWNFLFGGSFLSIIAWRNPQWLGKFWVAYLIHLIPFFLINGILTGSFIEEQIVWYNNNENLNLRLHTIPIEDTVYALLLLLMNVFFFETLKNHGSYKHSNLS